jgi:uncharacterized protein (DUF952 family)
MRQSRHDHLLDTFRSLLGHLSSFGKSLGKKHISGGILSTWHDKMTVKNACKPSGFAVSEKMFIWKPCMTRIYKISPRAAWDAATQLGVFAGAPVDLADGYIHFSTAAQMRETAAKHFAGQTGLVLAEIDASRLGNNLKWEASRGGDLFPHLYTSLPMDTVLAVHDLPVGADGLHVFPETAR